MKSKFFFIIFLNLILIFLFLMFHEKILTNLDKIIMPNSAELCKLVSNDLVEKLKMNTKIDSFDQIEEELKYLSLEHGGRSPKNKPQLKRKEKVAIIVPYRDRLTNLMLFIRNIHPFLVKQNIDYGVYVIEPTNNLTFNKGISINAGFIEALKEDQYDCFILHDVDLVPENEKNYYNCNPMAPKLMAVAISAYGYTVQGYFKNKYFGGVTAFTKAQFININGFSNSYYGWGLEDDDSRERVLSKYDGIVRLSPDVGRYYANCHEQQNRNPIRFILYLKACIGKTNDGLNTLEYNVAKIEKNYLFTRFYITYPNY